MIHHIQTKLPIFTAKHAVKPVSYTLTKSGTEIVTGAIDEVLKQCYDLREFTPLLNIKPNFK